MEFKTRYLAAEELHLLFFETRLVIDNFMALNRFSANLPLFRLNFNCPKVIRDSL